MTMLAAKATYSSSMGMGTTQAASAGQYSAGLSNHRTPVVGSSHPPFASPTESEFSEAFDGPESVR